MNIFFRYVVAVMVWLVAAPSWAAMTLGAAKVETNGSGTTLSPAAYTLTTGRGLVAMILWQQASGDTISSITVSGESNMTLIGTPSVLATGWTSQMAYLGSVTSGGSKTITVTFSGSISASYGFFQELHDGSNGGIALDGFCNASNAASTDPTCNVSTATANSAIFAVSESHDADPTVGANYTQLSEIAFFSWEASMYDLDAGAAGTYAANWTAASGRWTIAAAGFKAIGSSATVGCRLLQDGTSKRLLQNGTDGRLLQGGGDCALGGGGGPTVVPVRMMLGVGL